ncbi:MAG: NADH-quinone oxidoreductase subunit N, partial [Candidatus Acidiferrales bacterium]
MTVPLTDLLRILPELVLAAFGTLIVLVEPFLRRTQKSLTGYIALIGTLLALLSTLAPAMNPGPAFNGLVLVDGFSIFFHFLLLVITTLTIVASFRYLEREGLPQGEFYALLLFATIGMGLMASGNELVLVFLGLETVSIATYVLVGFRRTEVRSNEAAMKYFLLGSFATAFMLYGIALLFGATGTTFLSDIARQLAEGGGMRTLALMGMGLLFVGLGFKLALVPFQAWVPDVYEGAPTPVTAFLSAGPKAAVLAAFLRIFFTALEPLSGSWVWVIWATAILTMCIGNLG